MHKKSKLIHIIRVDPYLERIYDAANKIRDKRLWGQLDKYASMRRKRADANRPTPSPHSRTRTETVRGWFRRSKPTATVGRSRSGYTPPDSSAEDDRGRSHQPVPEPSTQAGLDETVQNALLQPEEERIRIIRHCK